VITRALGTDPDVDVDAFSVQPKPGDLYLLCSDGLSDMVAAEVIEEIMREYREDLDAAARALVRAANRGGGDDNITAVLFEIVGGDAPNGEPDERTRELPVIAHDEEDTLHPEDLVAPPPSAVDTMVVPPSAVEAALSSEAAQQPADPGAEPATEAGAPADEAPEAGLGRRLLALLVIGVLVAVIVVLVWWGLAR
jgi:hypothetical protein